MSSYADNWTSTPWQTPDPLAAVQHLQSLLCTAESDSPDQSVPQKVCTVVGDILANIEEKIKSHCRHKHLTHVEHRIDAATGNAQMCKAVQNTATTHNHALQEFTMIGRRSKLSTFGSRRFGQPLSLHHGR